MRWCVIIHSGLTIPKFAEKWDPDDQNTIWFAWDDVLDGSSISNSVWIIPANWTSIQEYADDSVIDGSVTYLHANGILLSTTETIGTHTITNRVTFADGRRIDRSVKVSIKSL